MSYALPLRILHSLLALCMLAQIAIGELMDVPGIADEAEHAIIQILPSAWAQTVDEIIVPETLGFETHEFLGLMVVGLILLRLILSFTSLPGANWRNLFPYLSAGGREILLMESKAQFAGWKQARLAPPEEGETVAKSVHGLILLAAVCMAITGTILFFGWDAHARQTVFIELTGSVHEMIVGGLEALLAAHILAVLLHQWQGHNILARIKPGRT